MHPVVQGFRSQQEGREICEDEPHVTIRVAGNDKEAFFGPVNEQHRLRFPEEWAAFEQGLTMSSVGTPIEHWPKLTHQPSLVRSLKNLAIFTVEDMAACSDAALQKIGMGGQKLREDAKLFLSSSKNSADAGKLAEMEKANKDQAEQIAELQRQMGEFLAAQAPKKSKKSEPAEA
jgi:hypothetical protein